MPQADGYDTRVIRKLGELSSPKRNVGARANASARVWFDLAPVYAGRSDFARDFADYVTAEGLPPTVILAAQLIDCWPTGAVQARVLVRILHPAYEPAESDHRPDLGTGSVWDVIGSSSHSYADEFGTMWATVDSPVGLAEAILHEMAHHKLRALGVAFENASRIVANHPAERYPSPILGGRLRPMPALLHAHYALLHMLALELEILSVGPVEAQTVTAALLRRHRLLLRTGDLVLWRNLVVDDVGAQFLPPLREWEASLFERSEIYR